MLYKLLGFLVWKSIRYYVRMNYPRWQRMAAGGVVAAGIAGLLVAGSRKAAS